MKLIQAVKPKINPITQLVRSKQTVDFKIGDASKIIEILRSKIYSNPIRTLVQEYLCNARDANREVGETKIIVKLPTEDEPTLKIKDYGPGISKERMLTTFVSYGSTTKADSNQQTGGFGLGSKLAWAYTDTFSIVTCVDGTEFHYVAHVGASKNGTLELISESETSEPNGTEIMVPVQSNDFEDFRTAVLRCIAFWRPAERPEVFEGTEIVESIQGEPLKMTGSVELYKKDALVAAFSHDDLDSKLILAVDGIAYPISKDFINPDDKYWYDDKNAPILFRLKKSLSHSVAVLHVGNGQVEVAASRESISENERTRSILEPKAQEAGTALKAWRSKILGAPKTLLEYVEAVKVASLYSSDSEFNFKEAGESYSIYADSNRDYTTNKLTRKYRVESESISKLEIGRFETNGSKRRRRKYGTTRLTVGSLIIVADESISQARQTMKVTQLMQRLGRGSAALVKQGSASDKFFSALAKRFNAVLLSSIELPKVERAEIQRAPKGSIRLQVFAVKSGYRSESKKTLYDMEVEANQQDKRFIYILNDKREGLERYSSLVKFLASCNISLCTMGVKGVEAVKGNSKFVSLAAFLAKPTSVVTKAEWKYLLDEAAACLVDDIAGKLEPIGLDSKLLASLKDKKLATDLKTAAENAGTTYKSEISETDDLVMEHLLKTDSRIKEMKALQVSLPKFIKAKYPLIELIGSREEDSQQYDYDKKVYVKTKGPLSVKEYQLELVAYLNGKAGAK